VKTMPLCAFDLIMIFIACYLLAESLGLILGAENVYIGLQGLTIKLGFPRPLQVDVPGRLIKRDQVMPPNLS
jgi:hypothetical protein